MGGGWVKAIGGGGGAGAYNPHVTHLKVHLVSGTPGVADFATWVSLAPSLTKPAGGLRGMRKPG